MIVSELFGLLGFKVDRDSLSRADAAIERLSNGVNRLAALATTALAGFGFGKAISEGVKFNASLEDSRNMIAGMLSLAKHTDLADQFGAADSLLASLQERAKKLPGSLSDYTRVLGMIAQPIADAGLSMQDLEDITVGASVAAMSMKIDLEAAARDVNQAIMGQFHATDQLTGRILGSLGYVGEEGRKRFNDLSKAQRAAVLKAALTQKQLAQLADAQSKSASGRWDTLKANISETLGRVAAPLFRRLSEWLEKANTWLEKNSASVDSWAATIGGALVDAFDAAIAVAEYLKGVWDYLGEHPTLLGTVLAIGAGIALWMSPILQIIAAVTALIALFEGLQRLVHAIDGELNFKQMEKYAELRKQGMSDEEAKAVLAQDSQGRQRQLESDAAYAGTFQGGSLDDLLAHMANAPSVNAEGGYLQGTGAPALPGSSTSTTSVSFGDINVTIPNGVDDAQGIAGVLKAELAKAYDNRRGGRR